MSTKNRFRGFIAAPYAPKPVAFDFVCLADEADPREDLLDSFQSRKGLADEDREKMVVTQAEMWDSEDGDWMQVYPAP